MALLCAPAVQAFSLGAPQLLSSYGNPLHVRVPVDNANVSAFSRFNNGLDVRVLPADAHQQYGLPKPVIPYRELSVRQISEEGRLWIEIRSQRAIREPVLFMLVEARNAGMTVVRELALVMEFPEIPPLQPASASTARAAVRAPRAPAPVPRPAPPRRAEVVLREDTAAIVGELERDGGRIYGPVAQGETLSEIAQRVRRDRSIPLARMIDILYRANPHAFAGTRHSLLEGALLRVPDAYARSGLPSERGLSVALGAAERGARPQQTVVYTVGGHVPRGRFRFDWRLTGFTGYRSVAERLNADPDALGAYSASLSGYVRRVAPPPAAEPPSVAAAPAPFVSPQVQDSTRVSPPSEVARAEPAQISQAPQPLPAQSTAVPEVAVPVDLAEAEVPAPAPAMVTEAESGKRGGGWLWALLGLLAAIGTLYAFRKRQAEEPDYGGTATRFSLDDESDSIELDDPALLEDARRAVQNLTAKPIAPSAPRDPAPAHLDAWAEDVPGKLDRQEELRREHLTPQLDEDFDKVAPAPVDDADAAEQISARIAERLSMELDEGIRVKLMLAEAYVDRGSIAEAEALLRELDVLAAGGEPERPSSMPTPASATEFQADSVPTISAEAATPSISDPGSPAAGSDKPEKVSFSLDDVVGEDDATVVRGSEKVVSFPEEARQRRESEPGTLDAGALRDRVQALAERIGDGPLSAKIQVAEAFLDRGKLEDVQGVIAEINEELGAAGSRESR